MFGSRVEGFFNLDEVYGKLVDGAKSLLIDALITTLIPQLIHLRMTTGERTADVRLLRSDAWLAEHDARVGGQVSLNMPEMGVEGPAEVLAIEPCPALEEGEGG